MRPAEVLARATSYLEAHDVDEPRRAAEILMEHVLRTDRATLYSRTDALNAAEARAFGRALCRRCAGSPLQHVTGEQSFRSITLRVRPGVFIPRPETEIVVDAALEVISGVPSPTVVDVGTGAGAIALSIKAERPDARVFATDVSDEAIELARENAGALGLDVEVLAGDVLGSLPPDVRASLVVSNPPYVTAAEYATLPPEVLADPERALLGGTELHARLAAESSAHLSPGGWLVMEIGATQGGEVAALLRDAFIDVAVLPDLAGRDRVVRGRLR
ncbi:MAG: peptide chain release factor N(5)-glutamine methyltransferase [Actinomycetota bacterium]